MLIAFRRLPVWNVNFVTSYTSGHRRGVTAAPHHAAAEAGRLVLADGGNALEAMVAMAASIAAVYPHMTHIGGDGFWVAARAQRPHARD